MISYADTLKKKKVLECSCSRDMVLLSPARVIKEKLKNLVPVAC